MYPTRLELVASAMRERQDSFPKLSGACKTPANHRISALMLFLSYQRFYSGCCTRIPSRDTHRTCARLDIYATLPPLVIKATETDEFQSPGLASAYPLIAHRFLVTDPRRLLNVGASVPV